MSQKIDKVSIGVSLALLATLVICTIFAPDATTSGLVSAKNFVVQWLGFYFILMIIFMLGYNLWLALSKYGGIRLGKEKPQYNTFGWIAMVFCAAMGTSILYWSAIEWMYYVQWPPFGIEPMGAEIEELSVAYSFFHWGIPAWSVYATGVIPIAYRYFVRKKEGLGLQDACEGVLGRHAYGPIGRLITIIFIFGILGGLTISYGTGVPMLANNLANIAGTPETFPVFVVIVLIITAAFSWSALSGLKKGIQMLSKITTVMALALIGLFLFLGNGLFQIENTVQATGLMFQHFPQMLFYLDPARQTNFPQDWTVFYWAWWLGLAPVMWIFIAKISAGRSIRSVVLTVMLAGSAGSIAFFGSISNYGLGQQMAGVFDFVSIMGEIGEKQAISAVVLSLPAGKAILALWLLTGFILLITTMDSASYTMGAATVIGLGTWDDPPKPLRIFWAAMLTITPLCLLYAGSSLSGFQSVLILTSIPVSFCIIMAMISCSKWLKEDYGHKTREEIQLEYMLDEDRIIYEEKRNRDLGVQA